MLSSNAHRHSARKTFLSFFLVLSCVGKNQKERKKGLSDRTRKKETLRGLRHTLSHSGGASDTRCPAAQRAHGTNASYSIQSTRRALWREQQQVQHSTSTHNCRTTCSTRHEEVQHRMFLQRHAIRNVPIWVDETPSEHPRSPVSSLRVRFEICW